MNGEAGDDSFVVGQTGMSVPPAENFGGSVVTMIKLLDYYDVRKTINLDPETGHFEIEATQREFLYNGSGVTRSSLCEFIFHRFTIARSSLLSKYRLAAAYCLSGHLYLQIDSHR